MAARLSPGVRSDPRHRLKRGLRANRLRPDLSTAPYEPSDRLHPVASRNSAIALIDEGNALEEQGLIAEAMARYDAAIQVDPQCARAHLNRGNILLARAT